MSESFPVIVRCFARLKEITGTDQLPLTLPTGSTAGDAKQLLRLQYPEAAALNLLLARNGKYARDEDRLSPGDELACFPPVSGG